MTRRILIFSGLDLIGDGLMKLPFLRSVRQAWPQAQIIWMTGFGQSVFSTTLKPATEMLIDQVWDQQSFGQKYTDILGVRPFADQQFDVIIDTQRRVKTTLLLKRIPHQLFISGTWNFFWSDRKPPKPYRRPAAMVQQMLDLLKLVTPIETVTIPLALPIAEVQRAEQLLPSEGTVGLAPGAGGRHKCWPLSHFIQLANHLTGQGHPVVFLLGPDEKEWKEELEKSCPAASFPLQQIDKITPTQTIAIAQRLAAAVANDSGIGHMIALADIPLISLFGPTKPEKFRPAARFGYVLQSPTDQMVDLSIDRVMSMTAQILSATTKPAIQE